MDLISLTVFGFICSIISIVSTVAIMRTRFEKEKHNVIVETRVKVRREERERYKALIFAEKTLLERTIKALKSKYAKLHKVASKAISKLKRELKDKNRSYYSAPVDKKMME